MSDIIGRRKTHAEEIGNIVVANLFGIDGCLGKF